MGTITHRYEPTTDEIQAACAAIQAGWSTAEERTRRGLTWSVDDRYEIPVVEVGQIRDGACRRPMADEQTI